MSKEFKDANEFKEFFEEFRKKILQASFAVVNYKESFLSAAAFIYALQKCDVEVDFGASEFVTDLTPKVVKKASKLFSVFEKDIKSHKNVENLHAVKMAFVRINLSLYFYLMTQSHLVWRPSISSST